MTVGDGCKKSNFFNSQVTTTRLQAVSPEVVVVVVVKELWWWWFMRARVLIPKDH
jgi:hypothetical protein